MDLLAEHAILAQPGRMQGMGCLTALEGFWDSLPSSSFLIGDVGITPPGKALQALGKPVGLREPQGGWETGRHRAVSLRRACA